MARTQPNETGPKALLEAIRFFTDKDVAQAFLVTLRWPDGQPTCPRCNARKVSYLKTRRLWTCLGCRKQFSAKVGTIFEDSPVALTKWLPAMWMVANCKNGSSSHELARALGVTQKTAWFMVHRIRLAMQAGTFEKFSGQVEVDETFIGGAARFMHTDRRAKTLEGRRGGVAGKAAVMGLLERHPEKGKSKVRARVVGNRKRHLLHSTVEQHVEDGAAVYTDQLASYDHLGVYYQH